MPPKKTSKNAFFYFMMDFKHRYGSKFNNFGDVADAAGPHWSKMSQEERQPYEERASKNKNNLRGIKLTSDSLDVEELDIQDRKEQEKIQEMKDDINCNLKMAYEAGCIQDELFFIIHINTYCYCVSEARYYPAEIAVSCFSLEDGVFPQNVFHHLIKPGALPLGYAGEAKLHSNQTHQLRVPFAEDYDSNIEEVFVELKQFLSTKLSGSKRFPLLYTEEKMLKTVQNILDTWCYDFGESRPLFKVYNLQYMFRVLKNIISNNTVWPSDTYSMNEIEKDPYVFSTGICCEFHEVSEVIEYCSRSIVVRYAYIICDNCCQDLGIILVPGAHIPDSASTSYTRCSSRASSISEASITTIPKSIRKDETDSFISFSSQSELDNESVSSKSFFSLNRDHYTDLGTPSNSEPYFSTSKSELSQSSYKSDAGAIGFAGLSRRLLKMSSLSSKNYEHYQVSGNSSEAKASSDGDTNNIIKDIPLLSSGRVRGVGRGRRDH